MFRIGKQKLFSLNIKISRTVFRSASGNASISKVPEYADVVIIGGGSAGCNALYHFGKHGINTVLLEKSKLISGTTWHTAGLVWSMRGPNDVEMELLKTTRHILSSLEKETGVNPGWINNGGLYIAQSSQRLAEYKRLLSIAKVFNIEARLLSPSGTKEMIDIVDENVIKGSVYCPEDGSVDPAMLINALTKSAKNHGCKIIEDCPVTKIHTKKDVNDYKTISGVETPYGVIRTKTVLNASGVWSGEISKMVGLDIPLIPMKHAYIVTESVGGSKDLPNIRDPDISLYFKVHGSCMSIGGYEQNPIVLKRAPENFSFSLYELDWNVFNKHIENMVKLMPVLSTTGIRSTICGPESFTPDHKPILGEDPRCKGFYYSCGYNSAGMMLGGGFGEQAALWVINGRPNKHMFGYDIRRFIPEQRTNSVWINERCHEAYVKNYNIAFPHDESLSGRNLKTDPFHNILLEEGAFMEERQGWERPGWFHPNKKFITPQYEYDKYYYEPRNEKDEYSTALEKEYSFDFSPHHDIIGEEALSCRKNAALFNMSYFGKYYLCGPEAQKAADYIFTSNTICDFNKTIYTCMLNANGGVEADCTVTNIDVGSGGTIDPIFKNKAFYVVAGGMSSYQTWAHMQKVMHDKNFEASLHDVTECIGVLSLQGPNSWKILQNIVTDDLSNKSFPFSTSKLIRIDGELVRLFRLSFVGELGFELHIPRHSCEKVFNLVMKSGKIYNMCLAGYRALYSLSCEKGYHLWNSDLRTDDNPVEAGLGFLCRSNSDYLGKAAVETLKKNGVKRKRVHVHIKENIPMWGLEAVYRNGSPVGYLRRAEYGYTFGNSIGQAYITHPDGGNVTKEFLNSGNFEIDVMGKRYPAILYMQSPFDPQNKRLNGEYKA